MSDHAPQAFLREGGFKGHGCAFCSNVIPVDDETQLPIAILAGGRTFRLWSHRSCLATHVTLRVATQLETIPSATRDEILAVRFGIG